VTHPDISGADLAGAIVASYVNLDQIMIDDQARSHFLKKPTTLLEKPAQKQWSKKSTWILPLRWN
jgi:hypothetical protein